MEFCHATVGFGRLGVSAVPHARRGASTLSTCRMASLRRLGPLPPCPGSLVKAPLPYPLVYRIGPSFCCRPPRKTDSVRNFGGLGINGVNLPDRKRRHLTLRSFDFA